MPASFRNLAGALFGAALALPCASCGGDPLVIGYLGGLTGPQAELGVAGRRGVELAVAERNAAGGAGGRRLELLVEDDGNSPAGGRDAVARLAARGARAVIGPMTSGVAVGAIPEARRLGLVLLSPTVSGYPRTGAADFWFTINTSSARMGAHLAAWFLRAGGRTAAAIFDESNTAYTRGVVEGFRAAAAPAGGALLMARGFPGRGSHDHAALAAALAASGADAYLLAASGGDAAAVCQALARLGSTRPRYAPSWTMTDDLLQHGGRAVEGLRLSAMWDGGATNAPAVAYLRRFRAAFRTEPGFPEAYAWEAVGIVADGLAATGGAGGPALRDTLQARASFPGLTARIVLAPAGWPERPLFPFTVRGGRFARAVDP